MNSLLVIKPYKWENLWVFDEPERGLLREPFVAGADRMIDVATANIPNADDGFLMFFSASRFPEAQIKLKWRREESGGNVYFWKDQSLEGWLCPALLKFFPNAPKKLFVQVKPAMKGKLR